MEISAEKTKRMTSSVNGIQREFNVNSLTTKKADDKIFVCKFSKNVKSKLYHTENSNTRVQTV